MNPHDIPGGATLTQQAATTLQLLEVLLSEVTADPGDATLPLIGYGTAINVSGHMRLVLEQLGIDVAHTGAFLQTLNDHPTGSQAQLDALDALAQQKKPGTDFALNEVRARNVLIGILDGALAHGVQSVIERVEKWLSGPRAPEVGGFYSIDLDKNSLEFAALVSLAYNSRPATALDAKGKKLEGFTTIGHRLRTALDSGNRAEAWFEIRYNTNKDALAEDPPSVAGGLAKRRFYEAELFGLYDPGADVANLGQRAALQLYQTYAREREHIFLYEKTYGSGASTIRSLKE